MKELNTLLRPDYVFEVSWEICNKVGGIHTVLMTKANYLEQQLGLNYILIGPDIQKEHTANGVFIEDRNLYSQWVAAANEQGIYIRIGRWNVPGSPVTILVDFSHYFTQKDAIFAGMWETYKLDSITGGWDYTEPALFGYATSKVVESFYQYYVSAYDKMVVHFHEWKTGMGLLNLKKVLPQAALVFTTHDTVPGRIMASEGLQLLGENIGNEAEDVINRTGQRAKFSLEKLSAINADCFTTVSRLNSNEAKVFFGKEACVITPNGFQPELVPQTDQLDTHRLSCRKKILEFASKFFGTKFQDDSLILFHSGRYEFKNKGTDLFIDALAALKEHNPHKQIIGIISVPANHSGPLEHVKQRILSDAISSPVENEHVTHHLMSFDTDLITSYLKKKNIHNLADDKVKAVYIPAWLDGDDDIAGMTYYDMLAGVDIGVFPSYYEPWGYTPLESLSFGIPAITTSLTGFAAWVQEKFPEQQALKIIQRNGSDNEQVVNQIVDFITQYTKLDIDAIVSIKNNAIEIAGSAQWDNFISEYQIAYCKALEQAGGRVEMYKHKQAVPVHSKPRALCPHWYKVLIKPYFPDNLLPLKELSQNLWWSWDTQAQQLFSQIHPQLWEKSGYNPIALLEMLEIKQIRQMENDGGFIEKLNHVHARFREYMSAKPESDKKIAYFCMEYGLHASVKLYSGGLGILAGDYLKEASDMNKNFMAVGLLYRYGYFNQKISPFGDQVSEKIPQKFTHLPISPVRDKEGNWITISLLLPGRTVTAKVWLMNVGRVPLYLLDTDIEENSEFDRSITHQLYGGDWENRLKQELLLGIGGIRMLKKIGIRPDLYHLNEGHAAFLNFERMRFLIQEEKLSFNQAVEVLRASSLFTTHTPVPAGHDAFEENLLRVYLSHYPQRFNISWEKFIGLGRVNENDPSEKFSMSVLALKLSQECNGVSRLHGKVSRDMFTSLYPGFFSDELHISHVTNGVHYSTWTAKEWQDILTGGDENQLYDCLNDKSRWGHIYNIPDETIWSLRNKFRAILASFLSEKLVKDYTARQEQPHILLQTLENIKPDVLTIGFARRFATYKRAHLLFSNPDRLSRIVNDPLKPVRFIFAGKAHPNDTLGQELIKKIVNWSKLPEFLGKVIFLDNYDAEIAKKMVQGVDVWLNTPTRPLEASGTSGQKCVMNGVLHFSVLDGWWAEGYVPKAGWALKEVRTYTEQKLQDELDAETIYGLFENDVIPVFYKRNQHGIPCEWIQIIKKNLCEVAPIFTMRRMMNDYYNQFYNSMLERSEALNTDNYDKAYRLASWKRTTSQLWENVKVIENRCHNSSVRPLLLGESFHAEFVIDTAGIDPEEIGIELLFGQKVMDRVENVLFTEELNLKQSEGNIAVYEKSVEIRRAGVLDFAVRIFIKNAELPHRTDFPLVKWG